MSIEHPYLLFLGDAPDALAAKVAQGIRDWRPDASVGQFRLPGCNADMGLPDMTISEAVAAGARTLVILTEFIPVQDVMIVLAAAKANGCRVVGPNTAGLVTPGECFVGIMPGFNANIFQPGPVGVISRSGSLGTLLCLNMVRAGFGQSAFVGLGGDPVSCTSTREALEHFDRDERTQAVVIVGEIGGTMEQDAAAFIKSDFSKPVAALVVGASAPSGKRMGHAGAIITGESATAEFKIAALKDAGAWIIPTPADIGSTAQQMLKSNGLAS